MKFAIVDIETTGGSASHNKITEIAIFIHDGEKIIDRFCSLVNPECSIPVFITHLTGISDEMVADAPKFFEIAKEIIRITDDATIVAHNSQFDYGFIREEYKSLGYNFTRDNICTVRLSRRLIPGYRSYSLGNLCAQLGIIIEDRHRASGDALATVKLFELLLARDPVMEIIPSFVKNDYLNLRFPPDFNRNILDKIPETSGVYYMHNNNGDIIYIGKSTNIRKRILSHFRNKQNKKAVVMRNAIRDISFEETGNELVALLLESEEIKRHQPMFNNALRKTVFNQGIFSGINEKGYLNIYIARITGKEEAIVSAGTYDEAEAILEKIATRYNLCRKFCGGKEIAHACFGYSLKLCSGACVGNESPESYNLRAYSAVSNMQFTHDNFMIIGKGRTATEKTVTHVESGKYRGFGFFDTEFVAAHPDILRDHVKKRDDNRDVHRIIRHFLNTTSTSNILVY